MILVDTNVLVDVVEDDPEWAAWSVARLEHLTSLHALAINPVVYAELSVAFEAMEEVDAVIDEMALKLLEIPRPALFLAGKAVERYRRRGGRKTGVLADFFIGAHASVARMPILTRDPARYRGYFPKAELITP